MGVEERCLGTLYLNKAIICLAPHTSNYDFLIGQLYARAEQQKSNFLMKKEWFFWPLGPIFRRLGGIAVWRDKHTSMTDRLAEHAMTADSFQLCITPRGYQESEPRMEERLLLYSLKSAVAHPPLWLRLRKEANSMFESNHTIRQH